VVLDNHPPRAMRIKLVYRYISVLHFGLHILLKGGFIIIIIIIIIIIDVVVT